MFWREQMDKENLEWQQRYGPYTPVHLYQRSARAHGKVKSKDRQIALLKLGRVHCHCIGGLAMKDPDLQKLIKKRFMEFIRYPYAKGWGGDYDLRRTVAVITTQGQKYLDSVE
jgi:hypothetical protein